MAVAVGMLCALAVPLLYAFVVGSYGVNALDATGRAVVGFVVMWTLAGALCAFTVFVERRSLSTIGIKPLSLRLFAVAVVAGVALSLLVPLVSVLVTAVGGGPSDIPQVADDNPLWVLGLGVVTAAVTEEVIFRGYLLERLMEVTRNRALSAFVSLAAFVVIHVAAWTFTHVLGVVLPLGAALTGLYLWRRNVPLVITVHFFVNAPLLFLSGIG